LLIDFYFSSFPCYLTKRQPPKYIAAVLNTKHYACQRSLRFFHISYGEKTIHHVFFDHALHSIHGESFIANGMNNHNAYSMTFQFL